MIQELRHANLDTNVYRNKTMWHLGLIYSTYGISYLVFTTFLVDYLIADVGFTNSSAGTFFAIAGITSIISGFIWGSLSDRFGRLVTLMIVFFIQSILLLTFSFQVTARSSFYYSFVRYYALGSSDDYQCQCK